MFTSDIHNQKSEKLTEIKRPLELKEAARHCNIVTPIDKVIRSVKDLQECMGRNISIVVINCMTSLKMIGVYQYSDIPFYIYRSKLLLDSLKEAADEDIYLLEGKVLNPADLPYSVSAISSVFVLFSNIVDGTPIKQFNTMLQTTLHIEDVLGKSVNNHCGINNVAVIEGHRHYPIVLNNLRKKLALLEDSENGITNKASRSIRSSGGSIINYSPRR